jgi:hypothetical protein
MELTQKQKREIAILDVCFLSSQPISSVTIASKLNVKSDTIYFGRKVQHIIGDLVYSKKLVRSQLQVQIHGKTLPTYEVTPSGKILLEELKRLKAESRPSSANSSSSFNLKKGNATDVSVVPNLNVSKKTVLSEAKIVAKPKVTDPLSKVVPLPDKLITKAPPYPAVGKPGLLSGALEVKLREIVELMKVDGGKEAFINIARITLENEQRLQKIESTLSALGQILNGIELNK